MTGAQGVMDDRHTQGVPGVTGAQGSYMGATGAMGLPGPTGLQGLPGTLGATGAQQGAELERQEPKVCKEPQVIKGCTGATECKGCRE